MQTLPGTSISVSVVHTTDVRGGRTSVFWEGAPSRNRILWILASKYAVWWHAAVSVTFIGINWPKFNFLKLIVMKITSPCSSSSIKAKRDHVFCSNFSSGRPFLIDPHSWLLTLQLARYVLWCELANVITYNNFTVFFIFITVDKKLIVTLAFSKLLIAH